MQLLSSASAALQKSDIELSLDTSRRTFGAPLPSIYPCTTARHNLATSFTRALSEPKPTTRTTALAIARARTRVQTCFASDQQCQTAKEQAKGSRPRSRSQFLSFYRGQSQNRQQEPAGTGGAERDRTDDLLLAKQALSQLSYSPNEADRP